MWIHLALQLPKRNPFVAPLLPKLSNLGAYPTVLERPSAPIVHERAKPGEVAALAVRRIC